MYSVDRQGWLRKDHEAHRACRRVAVHHDRLLTRPAVMVACPKFGTQPPADVPRCHGPGGLADVPALRRHYCAAAIGDRGEWHARRAEDRGDLAGRVGDSADVCIEAAAGGNHLAGKARTWFVGLGPQERHGKGVQKKVIARVEAALPPPVLFRSLAARGGPTAPERRGEAAASSDVGQRMNITSHRLRTEVRASRIFGCSERDRLRDT